MADSQDFGPGNDPGDGTDTGPDDAGFVRSIDIAYRTMFEDSTGNLVIVGDLPYDGKITLFPQGEVVTARGDQFVVRTAVGAPDYVVDSLDGNVTDLLV